MIETAIERWHAVLRGEADLDDLLHEDCVFWSPVLFRAQQGRELTKMYLQAAAQVFPGDSPAEKSDQESEDDPTGGDSAFRYTRRVLDGHLAVLEFETNMGGIAVNGVDIITCDDDGMITEFKVMLRPMKAVEAVRDRMAAMLETLGGG